MKHFFVLLLLLNSTILFGQRQKMTHPNILWITCEDMSPHLGSYGDPLVKTPNLDKLASEGIRYTNVFATAGVCAPSRSSIITGMYQQSIGTQHMRTHKYPGNTDSYPPNYVGYSAVIPADVKCFPEYLRANGYYCSNNVKEDYQFEAPVTVWDESSKTAHWRNRKNPEQPFFSVFNLMTTHESQVWMRANEPLLVDPKNITVPPYYPDVPEVRLDIARHLSNVMVMDQQAGEILRQLEEDGLADNTIVFFYSDHGDGLPFVKREIYDRGIRVPMIIRFGKNWKSLSPLPQGKLDDQLISLVDLAPTMLSITGNEVPDHLQGHAFLGPNKTSPRKYIFAARDRMDSEYDRVRCIRDSRFMYLRNYMQDKPYYQNIKYRLQQSMMPVILKMRDEGSLNDKQMHWFKLTKPEEELYDCDADPYQFNNLADDLRYKKKLEELKKAFNQWMNDVGDLSEIPESKMVQQWWNGGNQAPVTAMPKADQDSEAIKLTTATRGASIGYRLRQNDNWKIYTEPVTITGTDTLQAVAQRIGYSRSDTVSILLKK